MAQYSIIIAAPEFTSQLPVLTSLRSCALDPQQVEIFVTTGHHPARQRNRALPYTTGEWILFLDSDCRVTPDYFQKLDAALATNGTDVLGGPVLLDVNGNADDASNELQPIFQSALSHPLAVGASAARYSQRGVARSCTDAELILCNLAVRRDLFVSTGEFNPELYPNEENEWLDRAVAGGARLRYDPALTVQRPQRASWEKFFVTLLTYGAGRARQTLISRRWNMKLLPGLLLFLWFAATWDFRMEVSALTCLWAAVYVTVIALTAPDPFGFSWKQRFTVGGAALSILFFYALGQWLGLAGWPSPHAKANEGSVFTASGVAIQ